MKNILIVILLLSGSLPHVWAAQLDAKIFLEDDVLSPSFSFLRIIYIEYPEGGEISQLLRGENQKVSFLADSDTPGMKDLLNQLNENLESLPSTMFVTDAKLYYQAILIGNQKSAVFEIKIQMVPTFTNPVIQEREDRRTIDANWRGLNMNSSIIFESSKGPIDINNPKNALDLMVPKVMEKFQNVNVKILELPMIDSSGILELPLYKWHSLFDNTAIIASSEQFNYTGKYVLTHYSMGECNIFDGFCEDRKWIQEVNLDKKYRIVVVESRDDASITIEGYSVPSFLGSIETFESRLLEPVNEERKPGGFPETVMYGMAGMAAIGGITLFFLSNRKLKKDKDQGQTGINPASLTVYEISNSAGGYKTNRGEAYFENCNVSKMPVSYKL